MKKNLTEIVFILDRSGSMSGLEADTIGGFNSMIEKQRKADGEALVSTVLFDNMSEVIHDRVDIRDIKPMTDRDYTVRGCTALLDAIGGAIHHIGNVHKYARPEDVPEHTLFIITTDGMENASRFYSSDRVKQMIERQKAKYGWEFLFLGANIDAVETARHFGIGADRAVNFHSDSAYQAALDVIREKNIRYFLDIGGNTGRFTFKALKTWPKSKACIVDLPEQITLMKHNSTLSSVADRIDTYPINWLDKSSKPLINKNIDLIRMSQFLDCFSREQAISILKRVHSLASEKQATIAILEPLVDKQRNSAATLSIASTSLYFSCLANGNSKFFTSKELKEIIDEAGLQIVSIHEPLGVGHSLYLCI